MTSWAKPGVKCVCILNAIPGGYGDEKLPVKGVTYTVRAVHVDGDASWLQEIRNPRRHYADGEEVCFLTEGFRPLITKSQDEDVALFRRLLADAPLSEELDA